MSLRKPTRQAHSRAASDCFRVSSHCVVDEFRTRCLINFKQVLRLYLVIINYLTYSLCWDLLQNKALLYWFINVKRKLCGISHRPWCHFWKLCKYHKCCQQCPQRMTCTEHTALEHTKDTNSGTYSESHWIYNIAITIDTLEHRILKITM